MRALTSSELLGVWEQGTGLHAIDYALLVLRHAYPEYTHEALAAVSLGQRDALLLKVRQQIFGDRLEAYVECPNCQERLEFSMSCDALMSAATNQENHVETITIDGIEFNLRCPDSRDAAAAAASGSVEAAKQLLLARCAVRSTSPAESSDALPPATEAAIAAALAAADPRAELLMGLSCPACRCEWQGLFEIATFLWAEVRARARRLLQEVDAIARTYGWSEADILRMTDARRQLYLQMAVS
jgi:hypothetical protein